MQITIIGWNYEGAAFRGIESSTDEQTVDLTLIGDEQDIVNFVLEQFSYGSDEAITSVADLAAGYENEDIPNGDGCGGVIRLMDNDRETLFTHGDADDILSFDKGQPIIMTVDFSKTPYDTLGRDVLNNMVAEHITG